MPPSYFSFPQLMGEKILKFCITSGGGLYRLHPRVSTPKVSTPRVSTPKVSNDPKYRHPKYRMTQSIEIYNDQHEIY
uniref:Uncharacterized protein n=1 Tax=Meloidogyne enterolobii TaxID=390850 RepID=A0A6V7XD79_MELEN|nr:unnamed protein product [Meloidogyne enterolobii]